MSRISKERSVTRPVGRSLCQSLSNPPTVSIRSNKLQRRAHGRDWESCSGEVTDHNARWFICMTLACRSMRHCIFDIDWYCVPLCSTSVLESSCPTSLWYYRVVDPSTLGHTMQYSLAKQRRVLFNFEWEENSIIHVVPCLISIPPDALQRVFHKLIC